MSRVRAYRRCGAGQLHNQINQGVRLNVMTRDMSHSKRVSGARPTAPPGRQPRRADSCECAGAIASLLAMSVPRCAVQCLPRAPTLSLEIVNHKVMRVTVRVVESAAAAMQVRAALRTVMRVTMCVTVRAVQQSRGSRPAGAAA